MRLLFIRHGEPDYEHDSLTSAGRLEAQALAELSPHLHIDHAYVSPLGRAQETASYSLKKLGLEAETLDWLQEFTARLDSSLVLPGSEVPELIGSYHAYYNPDGSPRLRGAWDMYPAYLRSHPEYFDPEGWKNSAVVKHSDFLQKYEYATAQLDVLLARHGYVRDEEAGRGLYRAVRPNEETVAFFCHFAISTIFLSHLWGVSPFVPLHTLCMAPTSVTETVTEERQEGIAIFRTLRVGDTSHLAMAGLEPSFFARFCEMYSNKEQRH